MIVDSALYQSISNRSILDEALRSIAGPMGRSVDDLAAVVDI
jgi:hypothetical protein